MSLQPLPYIPHAGGIFVVGGEVFYYHRHPRVLSVGQAGVELKLERALAACAFFELECIFLLEAYVLEMAAADRSMQLFEAFVKELVVEEISLRGCDHVHDIQMGSEFGTVHIFDEAYILVRAARNHPGHRLYAELSSLRLGSIDDLTDHGDSFLPKFRAEVAPVASVPSRTAWSTYDIHAAQSPDRICHTELLYSIIHPLAALRRIGRKCIAPHPYLGNHKSGIISRLLVGRPCMKPGN